MAGRTVLTGVLVAALILPIAAQADISGRWDVESATSIRRNADGTVEVLATSKFSLTITIAGERAAADWQGVDGGEPALSLQGTWANNRLDLASAWFDTEADNRGQAVVLKARWVMRGSISGGRLGGTRWIEIQGRERAAAPISWVGVRHR